MKPKSPSLTRKAISLLASAVFLISNTANAAPLKLVPLSPKKEMELPVVSLLKNLPENLGRVEKSLTPFLEGFYSSMPFVIHIQDAHANPEAQLKINEILKWVEKNAGAAYSSASKGPKARFIRNILMCFRILRKQGRGLSKTCIKKGN